MKWLKRIAQGFNLSRHTDPGLKPLVSVGFYREAVIHYSPGLQPWVTRTPKHALKVASEALDWYQLVSTIEGRVIRPTTRINTPSPRAGSSVATFRAISLVALPRAEALGSDLPPLRGENPTTSW